MDNNKLINKILDCIKNNNTLKDNIVIKGGVAISIYKNIIRFTKDIDGYMKEEYKYLLIDELNKVKGFILEIYKSIIRVSYNESSVVLAFKDEFANKGDVIERGGLLLIDPIIIILDKIDRFSRIWCNQIKEEPYELVNNWINGNYQRDLLDLYILSIELDEISKEYVSNKFEELKERNINSKNYEHYSLSDMLSKYKEGIYWLSKNKFLRNGYPTTLKELILKTKSSFEQNIKIDDFNKFINILLMYDDKLN